MRRTTKAALASPDSAPSLATTRTRRQTQKPKRLSYNVLGETGTHSGNDDDTISSFDDDNDDDEISIQSRRKKASIKEKPALIPKPLVIHQEFEDYPEPYSLESLFYQSELERAALVKSIVAAPAHAPVECSYDDTVYFDDHKEPCYYIDEDMLVGLGGNNNDLGQYRDYMWTIPDPPPLVRANASRRWLVLLIISLPETMKQDFVDEAHFHACTTHDVVACCQNYNDALDSARRTRRKFPRFFPAGTPVCTDDFPPYSTAGLPKLQDADEDILIFIKEASVFMSNAQTMTHFSR